MYKLFVFACKSKLQKLKTKYFQESDHFYQVKFNKFGSIGFDVSTDF